jgi:hypothetical protein
MVNTEKCTNGNGRCRQIKRALNFDEQIVNFCMFISLQMLVDLEKRHQELLETVRNLEEQKSIIEGLIKKKAKIPWPWGVTPTTHPYAPATEAMCGSAASMDAPMSMSTSAIVAS